MQLLLVVVQLLLISQTFEEEIVISWSFSKFSSVTFIPTALKLSVGRIHFP